MDRLLEYLLMVSNQAVIDLYRALDQLLISFGVDDHDVQLDNLVSTAGDRDVSEMLAFLQSVMTDQVSGILLAHKIDGYPTSLPMAYEMLYALSFYQSLDDTNIALGIIENGDNHEDTWAELIAYANNTQAEDYLSAIYRVAPEAMEAIEAALLSGDVTEDEDYDEDRDENPRLVAVPWVRQRVQSYRHSIMRGSVILDEVVKGGFKLALPPAIALQSLEDLVFSLPEDKWAINVVAIGLASRISTMDIPQWTLEVLNRYTDNPAVTQAATTLTNALIEPE